MLKLFKYLKPYIWLIIPLIILIYLQVMANLSLPDLMAKIVDNGIIGGDMNAIIKNGLIMLGVTLGGGIAAVGVGFLSARTATGFARDVRQKVFKKVEGFSIVEFNKFSTASLITRSTNDIQQIQSTTLMILRLVIMAPLMAIGGLQKAMENAPDLSWIIAVAVVSLLVVIIVLFVAALPKFKLLQKMVDKLNLVTRENLTGLRVVRAFNKEKTEENKFNDANTDLLKLNLTVNRMMIIMQPFMNLVMNMALIAIGWFGAHLVSERLIDVGNMMAFMQYATQVIMSFLMISMLFIMIPRASVSAKRVNEVIDTDISIKDPKESKKVKKAPGKGNGRVEFHDVTFTYPDAEAPVLSGVNFTAEPGQTTAIIGSTGSGKSTLIGLIPRFYDVSAGQILIDNVDIRDQNLSDLYSQIGYVPQKGVLFSGSIKSNVAYGNTEASAEEIENAIKVSQSKDFVQKKENGVNASISQGGANVSGGQKQRLSIARALAVKPKVYIFDDSFSALDFKTEAKLKKELKKETKNKTVLIVAQRISTIINADKIIVMNEGKIVGEGTHQELLKNNSVYQEIASSQLSEEELKDSVSSTERKETK